MISVSLPSDALLQHLSSYLGFSYVQAGFRKGRRTRDQIANIHWIIEKTREFQKTSISALLTMPKPLTMWITINCGKSWKRWEFQTTWPASWETLYAGQDITVRTGHEKTDWFQIGKGVRQGCILSPCLFNFYAEYIMRNAGLEETQAGIKIAGRNINNLRYADDTTLMAESEEELKSLLMKVKVEGEKVGLKLQKTKIFRNKYLQKRRSSEMKIFRKRQGLCSPLLNLKKHRSSDSRSMMILIRWRKILLL